MIASTEDREALARRLLSFEWDDVVTKVEMIPLEPVDGYALFKSGKMTVTLTLGDRL